jgi:hypothetical protein
VLVRVGAGAEAIGADADEVVTAPESRETSLSWTGFPAKKSAAESEGSADGAGGKMSAWNDSDWRCGQLTSLLQTAMSGRTLRGTMNAMGSM